LTWRVRVGIIRPRRPITEAINRGFPQTFNQKLG
jgi:hypothetical protein